jgi:protein-S-isoprenylcysteine O-methyltransferase Ste14
VLLSSLLLLLLFWQWRPIATIVWRAEGVLGGFLTAIYWLGWLIALASTFMIDHFDLFGLKQAYAARKAAETSSSTFRARWLYRFVRHPLMLGFLLAFWATAVMTIGHLAFSLITTAYILIALQWEERDLIAEFGETYQKYHARVPMLLPFSLFRRESLSERTAPRAEG